MRGKKDQIFQKVSPALNPCIHLHMLGKVDYSPGKNKQQFHNIYTADFKAHGII